MMTRPRFKHGPPSLWKGIRYMIIDGYVDEPALFGVPPFIAPQVRSMAGGMVSGGAFPEEIGYATIDQLRAGGGGVLSDIGSLELLVILAGCNVPGKYLRGEPISKREVRALSETGLPVILVGPAAERFSGLDVERTKGDPGVVSCELVSSGNIKDRQRTLEEWNTHLKEGAFIVKRHPDHPSPLICEIETTRGCPRYISGGCSFCSEPWKGPMVVRDPADIVEEVARLASYGVENIRVGGQSDLVSYGSSDIGKSDVPEPDPEMLHELMTGVKEALHGGKGVRKAVSKGRRSGIDTGMVHTDNANPAVISAYPEASRKALQEIVKGSTSGTVLALGLESSDPEVKEENNLNSGPEEVLEAVRIMNETGRDIGENGMPRLLPGLNFLGGLPGQSEESFDMDIELLGRILDEGLMLRRINIRGALFPDRDGTLKAVHLKGALEKAFRRFKEKVRGDFDPAFLRRMLPVGSILRGVYLEARSGGTYFGRQIGSYPLLVGVPHTVVLGEHIDVCVTDHSSRSITGFGTPFDINKASFSDLQALPGIGKKRAAALFRKMPLKREDIEEIEGAPDWLARNISFRES
ncbi:MAG: radical SAM protein [Thermoplasmatota archaeon]